MFPDLRIIHRPISPPVCSWPVLLLGPRVHACPHRGKRVEQTTDTIIGTSPAMASIRSEVECAARSDAKVLLTGETGVGKDIAARVIHQRSARSHMAFVTINCVSVPDSLLEAELFGHVRGSFTGAYRDRPGLFETAHKGTVFLDEVCEMSPRMQALLLRFLETGEIQRVGSDRSTSRVDVRLIVRAQHLRIALSDLPAEIVGRRKTTVATTQPAERLLNEDVFDRMVKHRESFWSAVYPAFMTRDLTRADLRFIIKRGLE